MELQPGRHGGLRPHRSMDGPRRRAGLRAGRRRRGVRGGHVPPRREAGAARRRLLAARALDDPELREETRHRSGRHARRRAGALPRRLREDVRHGVERDLLHDSARGRGPTLPARVPRRHHGGDPPAEQRRRDLAQHGLLAGRERQGNLPRADRVFGPQGTAHARGRLRRHPRRRRVVLPALRVRPSEHRAERPRRLQRPVLRGTGRAAVLRAGGVVRLGGARGRRRFLARRRPRRLRRAFPVARRADAGRAREAAVRRTGRNGQDLLRRALLGSGTVHPVPRRAARQRQVDARVERGFLRHVA